MILVGGGAVNFHGYQRHSADVDFWIELSEVNLTRLQRALHDLGYHFDQYPEEVKKGLQNISVKISPVVDIELIGRFDPGKAFEEVYQTSERVVLEEHPEVTYHVLTYADLVESKIRSGRPKDLLDIQELQRLKKDEAE